MREMEWGDGKKAPMLEKNVEMHPTRKLCRDCVRAGTRGAFLLPESTELALRAAFFSITFGVNILAFLYEEVEDSALTCTFCRPRVSSLPLKQSAKLRAAFS